MKAIDGVEPDVLVTEASTDLLIEQRKEGVQMVKKLLHAIFSLSTVDIPKLEKELTAKKDQLAKKQAILQKFREGDWAALVEQKESQ